MVRNEHRQQIAAQAGQKTIAQLADAWQLANTTIYAILREFGKKPVTLKELRNEQA